MKDLQFRYHMDIEFSEPVHHHTYTLKCVPVTTTAQKITECSVEILPENEVQTGRDSFGNLKLYGNVEQEHMLFSVDVKGRAVTGIFSEAVPEKEMDISVYKYQTPLTRPGEELKKLYQACLEEKTASIKERVYIYMNTIYRAMNYCKGITNIHTSAEEALELGNGVCQDFAHILLSICREDKIPARYVVGMLLGEGESHAWVEVFDGERWIGFDPTNNLVVDDMHIKISHGRDYQDCSINRGAFTGQAGQTQRIFVEVKEDTP